MPKLCFRSGLRSLMVGEQADPRIPQALFLVPVMLELLMRTVTPGQTLDRPLALGLAVVGLTTVAAHLIARGHLPAGCTVALPVLDIVALGIMITSPNSASASVAVAFPAIWLGLQFGRRGVLLTVLATLLTVSLPTIVEYGWHAQPLSRAVQLLVMALLCSLVVHLTAGLWAQQRRMLTETSRRLEGAMTESRHQKRLNEALVHSVNVGLVMLDAQGAYRSMNPRHREFMAQAFPHGHAGRAGQLGAVFDEDGLTLLSRDRMPSIRATRGEEFTDVVLWVGDELATRRALAVSARAVRDPLGEFEGAVLSYQDVTDIVNASRMKDEFVARVSHELRTPLTSIIGYTDVLIEDVDGIPEEALGYLGTVDRNAHRLLRLVDDLLQTAEQSAGVTLDLAPLDLRVLLLQATETASTYATDRQLVFDVEADVVPAVCADADRLSQVFENLLSNAVKYTPEGGRVAVRLCREGDQVVVRFSDTGIGIEAEDRDQVFSKFYRSRQAEEMAIPGVGLGLAISRAIVVGHAGTISVGANPGGGTVFEVRLPLQGVAVATLQDPASPTRPGQPAVPVAWTATPGTAADPVTVELPAHAAGQAGREAQPA